MTEEIKDQYGRTFKTLRVSLTELCNLSCGYCVSGNNVKSSSGKLNHDQFVEIISKLNEILSFNTIRLTGGEPLIFKDIIPLIKSISSLGIDLKMTTNGFLLEKKAGELFDAGLKCINVSLDAIDEDIFASITRTSGANKVIKGIDAAIAAGINVKLNCVVLKDLNEDQLIPLLQFSKSRGIIIRYLELMNMGYLYKAQKDFLVSEREILQNISSKYQVRELPRKHSSTSRYWVTNDNATFGIISNISRPFCHDCDRLRLDSSGNIYGCLSSEKKFNIYHHLYDKEALVDLLNQALSEKKDFFTGSNVSMMQVGG
ncbi:MAG: GTP 3',8-cyclase MoaA [Cytophagaceae bacterium]